MTASSVPFDASQPHVARVYDYLLGGKANFEADRAVGDRIFKIITGGGAFVVPVLQKAQYLGMSADKALLRNRSADPRYGSDGWPSRTCRASAGRW